MQALPSLVVLTGYPRAGKSRLADYLCGLRFARLSTDRFRDAIFGAEYVQLNGIREADERMTREVLEHAKLRLLRNGRDVVIDATAPTHDERAAYLQTEGYHGSYPARKYLVWVDTQRSVIERRQLEAGRDLSMLTAWDAVWEAPAEGPGCTLLRYASDDETQHHAMTRDLTERLTLP